MLIPRHNEVGLRGERTSEDVIVIGIIKNRGREGDRMHHRGQQDVAFDELIDGELCGGELARELGSPQDIGEFQQQRGAGK